MNANSGSARMRALTGLAFVLGALTTRELTAQSPDAAALRSKIRAYSSEHDVAIVRELTDLLAIPNLASDSANIRRNAARLVEMMFKRGISARLLESPAGGPPAVFGELRVPGATRTVVLYAHYDGQPVDTTKWATPPWQPVLRDKALDAGGRVIPLPTSAGTIRASGACTQGPRAMTRLRSSRCFRLWMR
jgi:hypothetical protein